MGNFKIAVLPGDGIGPEITVQAIAILKAVGVKYNHSFDIQEGLIGGNSIDKVDNPLPEETIELCKNSDAVFLGAVGGPKWDGLSGEKRPEAGLLGIRKHLRLFANLRPAIIYEALKSESPLNPTIVKNGIDIMVVRELTGGIYFGERGRRNTKEKGESAYDTEEYSKNEVQRIAKVAFKAAMKRSKRVISIDKANVLESSRLWREVVCEIAKEYPQVELNHMYVDNAAMQLIRNPGQFDVILTSNLFGDILSDEASMITGSIGMLPSASLGDTNFGLFEPIHGSAPDIQGLDKANPIAGMLSIAMMLKYSFDLLEEAHAIENSVIKVLEMGYRTSDISAGGKSIGTSQMGSLIVENL